MRTTLCWELSQQGRRHVFFLGITKFGIGLKDPTEASGEKTNASRSCLTKKKKKSRSRKRGVSPAAHFASNVTHVYGLGGD